MNAPLNPSAFRLDEINPDASVDVPPVPRRVDLNEVSLDVSALVLVIDHMENMVLDDEKDAAPLLARLVRQFAQQIDRDIRALTGSLTAADTD